VSDVRNEDKSPLHKLQKLPLRFGTTQGLSENRVDVIVQRDTDGLIAECPKGLLKMMSNDPSQRLDYGERKQCVDFL
jgi:hypothetical protein